MFLSGLKLPQWTENMDILGVSVFLQCLVINLKAIINKCHKNKNMLGKFHYYYYYFFFLGGGDIFALLNF